MSNTPRRPALVLFASALLLVSSVYAHPKGQNAPPSNGASSPGWIYGRNNCNPRTNRAITTRALCYACCNAAEIGKIGGTLTPGQVNDCLWFCCTVNPNAFPGGRGGGGGGSGLEGEQPGSQDDNI